MATIQDVQADLAAAKTALNTIGADLQTLTTDYNSVQMAADKAITDANSVAGSPPPAPPPSNNSSGNFQMPVLLQEPTTNNFVVVGANATVSVPAANLSLIPADVLAANGVYSVGEPRDVQSPAVISDHDPHHLKLEDFGGRRVSDGDDTTYDAVNTYAIETLIPEYMKTLLYPAVRIEATPGIWGFRKGIRIVDGMMIIEGLSAGMGGNGGTVFRTPKDHDGITIDQGGPLGTDGWGYETGAEREGGGGSLLKGLTIWSRDTFSPTATDKTYWRKTRLNGTEPIGAASGILVRTGCRVEACDVTHFPGYGILHMGYSAAGWRGNTNCAVVKNTTVSYCGEHGFVQRGSDANKIRFEGGNAVFNGGYGFADFSFLGNDFWSPHTEANALWGISAPYPILVTAYNSTLSKYHVYKVMLWDEGESTIVAAKTTDPVTDYNPTTGGSVWTRLYETTGPSEYAPLWTSGMTVGAGGPFVKTNINSNPVIAGLYVEDGQPYSEMLFPGTWIGGFDSTGATPGGMKKIVSTF